MHDGFRHLGRAVPEVNAQVGIKRHPFAGPARVLHGTEQGGAALRIQNGQCDPRDIDQFGIGNGRIQRAGVPRQKARGGLTAPVREAALAIVEGNHVQPDGLARQHLDMAGVDTAIGDHLNHAG